MSSKPTTTLEVDANDIAIIRGAIERGAFKGKAAPFVAAVLAKLDVAGVALELEPLLPEGARVTGVTAEAK